MEIDIVKVDDKHRFVIPRKIREAVGIKDETHFFIYGLNGLLFIKPLHGEKAKEEAFGHELEKLCSKRDTDE